MDQVKDIPLNQFPLHDLENLYRDDIEEYRLYLRRKTNEHGEPLAINTITRKLSCVKVYF